MPQIIAGIQVATDEEALTMTAEELLWDTLYYVAAKNLEDLGLTKQQVESGQFHYTCGCWAEDGCECDLDDDDMSLDTDSDWDDFPDYE